MVVLERDWTVWRASAAQARSRDDGGEEGRVLFKSVSESEMNFGRGYGHYLPCTSPFFEA